jgi:hypothetical protein
VCVCEAAKCIKKQEFDNAPYDTQKFKTVAAGRTKEDLEEEKVWTHVQEKSKPSRNWCRCSSCSQLVRLKVMLK